MLWGQGGEMGIITKAYDVPELAAFSEFEGKRIWGDCHRRLLGLQSSVRVADVRGNTQEDRGIFGGEQKFVRGGVAAMPSRSS